MSESQVRDLEERVGVELPAAYRAYLVTATDKFLEDEIVFQPPRSGAVDEILTVGDILKNDASGRIGILEKSLMHIGGNVLGGSLYLDVSDQGFGQVVYMENYVFKETFSSFDALLSEPRSTPPD